MNFQKNKILFSLFAALMTFAVVNAASVFTPNQTLDPGASDPTCTLTTCFINATGTAILSGTLSNVTLRWNGTAWVENTDFLTNGGNSTSTNATTTNSWVSNILTALTGIFTNIFVTNAIITNATTTNFVTSILTASATSTFNGKVILNGSLQDSAGATGTANQVLVSTGTSTKWISSPSSLTAGTATNTTLRWSGLAWVENTLFTADGAGNATTSNLVATGTVSTTNLLATLATITNSTSTNLYTSILNAVTAYISNLNWTNATGTNATTTGSLATNILNGSGTTTFVGKVAIGTTTVGVNPVLVDGGVTLNSTSTPNSAGNSIYNSQGILYWNGLQVLTSATSTASDYSFELNGTTDYAGRAAYDAGLNINNEVTIAAWIKVPHTGTIPTAAEHTILSFGAAGETTATNYSYMLKLRDEAASSDQAELYYFHEYGAGTNFEDDSIGFQIANDRWMHVAITRTSQGGDGAISYYINGTEIETTSISNQASGGTTGRLYIGSNLGTADFFQGNIDDVRIYNRNLTGAEIGAIYNTGQGQLSTVVSNGLTAWYPVRDNAVPATLSDNSGNGYDMSITGGATKVKESVVIDNGFGGLYIGTIKTGTIGQLSFYDADGAGLAGTSVLTLNSTSSALTLNGSLVIASTTPATTTNTLYNNAGSLYWNGSAIGGGSTLAFSGLRAATTSNSLDNGTSTQIWSWSTATSTNGALQITANALTSGKAMIIQGGSTMTSTGQVLAVDTLGATAGSAISVTNTGAYIGTAGLVSVSANSATAGTLVNITGNSLTSGAGLSVVSNSSALSGALVNFNTTNSGSTGSTLLVSSSATAGKALSISHNSNQTGTTTDISVNGLTSGKGLVINSSATAFTGSLQEINLSGDNSLNTGTLMTINSTGANSVATGININTASSKGLAVKLAGAIAKLFGTTFATSTQYAHNVDLGNTSRVRVLATTTVFDGITGIAGGTDGEELSIFNASSTDSFILYNASTTSSVGNRIVTGTGADITISPDASVSLVYDATSAVWRVLGGSAGSSGSFSSINLANDTNGGNIGTAAATVDAFTNFNLNQTTGSQSITLPDPSNISSAAGKVVTINNTGSATFTMYGVQVSAGSYGSAFVWTGTAWNPINAASNVAAEYGENNGITSQTVGTGASYVDVTNSSFTLPSAGVWEVNYVVQGKGNSNGANAQIILTDSAGVDVGNSQSQYNSPGLQDVQMTLTQTVRITTTGATNYKLQIRTTGAAFTTQNSTAASGVLGGISKINWKKISGNTPVTGQSVDYGYFVPTVDSTVTAPQDLTMTNSWITSSGNIPVTSAGVISLTAGKTYKLEANLSNYDAGPATVAYQFVDSGTNAPIGTSQPIFNSIPVTSSTNISSVPASFIYTPSSDQSIKIRVLDTNGSADIEASGLATNWRGGTYIVVTQLGSSAITSSSIVAQGGNTSIASSSLVLGTAVDSTISIITNNVIKLLVGTTTTNWLRLNGYGAGTLTTDASGNVTASSDAKLKENETIFSRGLDAILGLVPTSYNWTSGSGLDQSQKYTGFIAQNVSDFIPEAVSSSSDGTLTLSDRPILAALVNATKELNNKTETNSLQINKLGEVMGISSTTLDQIRLDYLANKASSTEANFNNLKTSWDALRNEYQAQKLITANLSSTTEALAQSLASSTAQIISENNTKTNSIVDQFAKLNNYLFGATPVAGIRIEELTSSTTLSVDTKVKALGLNAQEVNKVLADLNAANAPLTKTNIKEIVTSTTEVVTDENGATSTVVTYATTTETSEETTLMGKIVARVVEEVTKVLASATNSVANIFAKNINAEEKICLGKEGSQVCMTKEQLENLLAPQNLVPAQAPEQVTTTSTETITPETTTSATESPVDSSNTTNTTTETAAPDTTTENTGN